MYRKSLASPQQSRVVYSLSGLKKIIFGYSGLMLLSILVLVAVGGCTMDQVDDTMEDWGWKDPEPAEDVKIAKAKVPPELKGTIGEYSTVVGGGDAPIGAIGVVVGLVKNGSSEVPPQFRNRLTKYIREDIKIGSAMRGTRAVSVDRFLDDRDTAVVRVDALIPPGAPSGTKFDVMVTSLPRTQTTSLQGGVLLPVDLTWEPMGAPSTRDLRILAKAGGTIFINPFLDPTKAANQVKLRQGRIMNGGVVSKPMKVRLQLHKPDYQIASLIQRRINYRFNAYGKIATAKNRYAVDIDIPQEFHKNYTDFLQLILHLPLRFGEGGYEAHARKVARLIVKPGANCPGLALVWEAMGRQILPIVQKVYSSKNADAAFYAAKAGLEMGDINLAPQIILKTATTKSPLQIEAIKTIGQNPGIIEGTKVLSELLNSSSNFVRVAAYEALIARREGKVIERFDIDGEFRLDIVPTQGDYMVYATQTGEPVIALFGKNMKVEKPIFFDTPVGSLTIFSKKGDPASDDPEEQKDHLVVYRMLPDGVNTSKKYNISFKMEDLVKLLGYPPRMDKDTGKIKGLGMTYSQIVSFLYRMSKQKNIQAKFVLQQLPEIQKIYQSSSDMGRRDTDEE